jgi:hypothetical protein
MFCALDLHRRNINRAISDNMVSMCIHFLNWILKHVDLHTKNSFRSLA